MKMRKRCGSGQRLQGETDLDLKFFSRSVVDPYGGCENPSRRANPDGAVPTAEMDHVNSG
jgi:hypothetical protein